MWVSTLPRWVRCRPVFRVIFFCVLILALYLGLRPSPTPATYYWISDLYHGVGLFLLMLLSYLGFPRWYWWARGLAIFAISAFIEYVQSFHPLRVADWGDLAFNGVGIVCGWIAILLFQRWATRRGDDGGQG